MLHVYVRRNKKIFYYDRCCSFCELGASKTEEIESKLNKQSYVVHTLFNLPLIKEINSLYSKMSCSIFYCNFFCFLIFFESYFITIFIMFDVSLNAVDFNYFSSLFV